MDRLVIVPDDDMESLALKLQSQLPAIARTLQAESLSDVIDDVAASALRREVEMAGADELIVWGQSGGGFLAAWSSKEPEDEVVGMASADGSEGLVARVFESQRSESPEGAELDVAAWSNLSDLRGLAVQSMGGSPLVMFDTAVAVVSLIVYQSGGGGKAAARTADVRESDTAGPAMLCGRLMEYRLLKAAIGLAGS